MLFYIEYGCSISENSMIVDASDLEHADEYAYQCAIEDYKSYEGYHGILDLAEVCEEAGIEDIDSDEAWETYHQYVEEDIEYLAEPYNEVNVFHREAMEESGIYRI